MRIPSAGQMFVIWFWTLIGLAVANYLFLLLAYDWRTYAVLGGLSLIFYLFSRGPRQRSARSSSQRGSWERTPYDPAMSQRSGRFKGDWEE